MQPPKSQPPRVKKQGDAGGGSSGAGGGSAGDGEDADDGSRAVREIDSFAGEIRDVLGSLGLSAVPVGDGKKGAASPDGGGGGGSGSGSGSTGRTAAGLLSPLSKLGI